MEIKLAAIKRMIETGAARDASRAEITHRPKLSTVVFYSVGRNGLSGIVLRDNSTGELLAVAGRCSNLFLLAY